ncbi:MAG: hypothetical protein MUF00_05465 [Gemmatimonadaceae bacterium]|jgi:hypothetical protein|nr:hypothetical protein [Gemmatimonadaceae bacterium]
MGTTVRLELRGAVQLTTVDADSVEVISEAVVVGRTIGRSNAAARAPYAVHLTQIADTLLIRPQERPGLRAVGLNWARERVTHRVRVSRAARVHVIGAARLVVDGRPADRCPPSAAVAIVGGQPQCVARSR